ncbi:MAG: ROK family protein [bacterium]|nr:ROK family protein [bacterium]
MNVLGIDLGATNTKLVILSDSDEIEVLEAFPTRGEDGADVVLGRLIDRVRVLISERGIGAVGMGTPGLFDPETGVVEIFTNLPGQWVGVPLLDRLRTGLGLPVTLINDARAFTLAEGTLGAGKGAAVMAGLTLGTGIGGGLLVGGELFHGSTGSAGEISHQTVDPDGPICGCGNQGCAEASASADALTSATGRDTVEDVYRGYVNGDEECVAAVERAAASLGRALANIVTVLGPDVIVIGGGPASHGGEVVLEPIRRATLRNVTLVPHEDIRIVRAELGSEAGAIGAAIAARSVLGGD